MRIFAGLALALLWSSAAIAQAKAIAFTGARILPISAARSRAARSSSATGRSSRSAPTSRSRPDAEVRDVSGTDPDARTRRHALAHRPAAGADSSAPIQPDVRVLDAIDVRALRHPARRRPAASRPLNVMPGSGHLLSGQTVYLKLATADTIDELALPPRRRRDRRRHEDGERHQLARATRRSRGRARKSAALVREQYVKAQDYARKVGRRRARRRQEAPARDLAMEGLCEVLAGKRIVQHHTHRHDDIVTVLRLAKEFGFRVVLHHVSEGWKVADEIARAGVPARSSWSTAPGGKLEAIDVALRDRRGPRAGRRRRRVPHRRLDHRLAAVPAHRRRSRVRAGMSREKALAALTLERREMLDLDGRVGSLEPGKDADFVVLAGDPLSRLHQGARDLGRGDRRSSTAPTRRTASTRSAATAPGATPFVDDELVQEGSR